MRAATNIKRYSALWRDAIGFAMPKLICILKVLIVAIILKGYALVN
jgi:hypothetical protein